jgi:hypothetical protein
MCAFLCLQVDEELEHTDSAQFPLVDTTLLEICKVLEDENSALKKQVEHHQEELEKCRNKAAKTSLIPHYRAAIVK